MKGRCVIFGSKQFRGYTENICSSGLNKERKWAGCTYVLMALRNKSDRFFCTALFSISFSFIFCSSVVIVLVSFLLSFATCILSKVFFSISNLYLLCFGSQCNKKLNQSRSALEYFYNFSIITRFMS